MEVILTSSYPCPVLYLAWQLGLESFGVEVFKTGEVHIVRLNAVPFLNFLHIIPA